MTIDITKPVRTRDGRAVRGLVKVGETHLAGFVDGSSWPMAWYLDGTHPSSDVFNLENVPPRREAWVNVSGDYVWTYPTRKEADRSAAPYREWLIELDLTNHTAKWHKVGGEG